LNRAKSGLGTESSMQCLWAFPLLVAYASASIFTDQCMHAVGRLQCPGHAARAAHVWLKLRDIDDGPNGDDLMDEGYSSEQGNFHLYGCARDAFGQIDATMDVRHNCTGRPQELTITVPKNYIGGTFNVTLNLVSPPANDVYKTKAFTGKLQPYCDQQHGHTHHTDRRRRSIGHLPSQERGSRTHVEHGWGGTQYSLRNRHQQCVHAMGKLTCRSNQRDAQKVFIQLVDEDKREGGQTDEVMDTAYTTDGGNFHLFGCAQDTVGKIDPVLLIKHKCGSGQHILTVKIPEAKIGGVFNETLDMQAPHVNYVVDNYSGRMPNMCDDLHSWGRQN